MFLSGAAAPTHTVCWGNQRQLGSHSWERLRAELPSTRPPVAALSIQRAKPLRGMVYKLSRPAGNFTMAHYGLCVSHSNLSSPPARSGRLGSSYRWHASRWLLRWECRRPAGCSVGCARVFINRLHQLTSFVIRVPSPSCLPQSRCATQQASAPHSHQNQEAPTPDSHGSSGDLGR